MGLDVYLYRYIGKRTYQEDSVEVEANRDALEDIWSKARVEIAGEPVKVLEDSVFGPRTTEKPLTKKEFEKLQRITRFRQNRYIEQRGLHIHIGEYGPSVKEEKIEIDSKSHPDHMFKIGYMRSSYNSGGFNQVVRTLVGYDLCGLFGVSNVNDYIVRPDWKKALVRCNALLDQIKCNDGFSVMRLNVHSVHFCETIGNIFAQLSGNDEDVINESDSLRRFKEIKEDVVFQDLEPFIFDGFKIWPEGTTLLAVIHTDEGNVILLKDNDGEPYAYEPKTGSMARKAMDIFNAQNSKEMAFRSFSCSDGDFFLDGISVYGLTISNGYSGPCADFIIHDEENILWYVEASEVVKEMIEWVLAKEEPNEYYFHWSA